MWIIEGLEALEKNNGIFSLEDEVRMFTRKLKPKLVCTVSFVSTP